MSSALSSIVLSLDHSGHSVSLALNDQAGIAESRNKLTKRAIQDFDADAILWMDSDIFCAPNSAISLINRDKDIVGATYLARVPPHDLCGKPLNSKPTSDLEEFEFLPSGFMFVKTSVYKAIPEPWYFETYQYGGEPEDQLRNLISDHICESLPPEILSSKEAKEWLSDAIPFLFTEKNSEDVSFCKKARRHGFKVWCDLNVTGDIVHMGKKGYSVRQ